MILLKQASLTPTSPKNLTLVMISSVQMLNSRSHSLTKANHTSHQSNSISTRPQSTLSTEIFTMPRSILCTSSRALVSPQREPLWTQMKSSMAPSSESSSIWKREAPPRTPSSKACLMLSTIPLKRSECASSSALLT